jgi:hypothetical protein
VPFLDEATVQPAMKAQRNSTKTAIHVMATSRRALLAGTLDTKSSTSAKSAGIRVLLVFSRWLPELFKRCYRTMISSKFFGSFIFFGKCARGDLGAA